MLLAAVTGCSDDPTGVIEKVALASAPIASVVLDVHQVSIGAGGTAVVNCQPLDGAGTGLGRNCNWRTRDTSVAQVSGNGTRIGTVSGRRVGATWLVANAESSRDSAWVTVGTDVPPPPPPGPGEISLVVRPASATLLAGARQQFTAEGKLSDGSSTPVAVSWSETGGSIGQSGSYTAGPNAGTYRVTATSGAASGTATITITPTDPPPVLPPIVSGASCFDVGPATITITGILTSWLHETDLPAGSRIDASRAEWRRSTTGVAVRPGNQANNCWHGGRFIGLFDPNTTSWVTYHDAGPWYGEGPNFVLEDYYAENFGDGFGWKYTGATNWTARRIHLKDMHDDCMEHDWMQGGRLDDFLFEGCYVFIATRPRSSIPTSVSGGNQTIRITNGVVWMKGTPTVYGGPANTTGPLFKVDNASPSRSPKMELENVVIRIDKRPGFQNVCLNPWNLVTHKNVTVVWLGGGSYPCLPIPPGVTLSTDVNVYLDAAAAWKAAHPGL